VLGVWCIVRAYALTCDTDIVSQNYVCLSYNWYVYIYWASLYQYIYQANASIEGLEKADNLNPQVKSQLLGEAKFIRAFCYFYLVNYFGDVPLILTTDALANNHRQIGRAHV